MSHEQPSTNPAENDDSVFQNNRRVVELMVAAADEMPAPPYTTFTSGDQNPGVHRIPNARIIETESDQRAKEAREEVHKAIDESEELAAH